MVVGCDIDGCLAQFESGFIKKLEQVRPGLIPPGFDWRAITTWDWDLQHGYTKEECSAAWELVKTDGAFWVGLNAYDDTRDFLISLWRLTHCQDDVYFCTHRFGQSAKAQTELWLRMHGWPGHPTVLLVESKGVVCKALQADFYLDDKTSHVVAVRDQSPSTKGYLLRRGWNHEVPGVTSVETLGQFLAALAAAKTNRQPASSLYTKDSVSA